jgi:hypothetical protein
MSESHRIFGGQDDFSVTFCVRLPPPTDILNPQLIHYKVMIGSYPFKHPRGYTYTS